MMTNAPASDPKTELRAQIRAARRAIQSNRKAEAEQGIATRLAALPAVRQATTVGVYHAVGSEADLSQTVQMLRALERAPRIAYPLVVSKEAMVFARFGAGEDLSFLDNPKKLQSSFDPARIVEPRSIDILLVPGIAFDGSGRRLGQGGGYYDRYLPHLRPDAISIGIAFDEQIVGEVPHAPYDRSVDYVVTPTRLITAC